MNVEKATEGAIEHGFGLWKARTVAKNRPLTTSEANATLGAPAFPGMSYGTAAEKGHWRSPRWTNGAPAASATRIFTNLLSYPGFRGFPYRYLVSAKMRQPLTFGTGAVAGVTRRVEYTEVPLFQSMFFFEGDLAIAQPAEIMIGGLIHTNSNLYLNGYKYGSLTVGGNASYAGSYSDTTVLGIRGRSYLPFILMEKIFNSPRSHGWSHSAISPQPCWMRRMPILTTIRFGS